MVNNFLQKVINETTCVILDLLGFCIMVQWIEKAHQQMKILLASHTINWPPTQLTVMCKQMLQFSFEYAPVRLK